MDKDLVSKNAKPLLDKPRRMQHKLVIVRYFELLLRALEPRIERYINDVLILVLT